MVELTQQEIDIISGVVTNELGVTNPTVINKIVENLTVQMQGIINRKLINSIKEQLVVADSVNTLSSTQEFLTKCLKSIENDIIQYEKNVSTEISTVNGSIDKLTKNVADALLKFDKLQIENAKLLKIMNDRAAEKVEKKPEPTKPVEKVENKLKKTTTIIDPKKPSKTKSDKKVVIEAPPAKPPFADITISDNNIEPPKPVQKKKKKKTESLIKRDLHKEHEAEKKEANKGNLLTTYLDMKFSDLIKVAKDKNIKIPPRSKKDDIAMLILEG